MREPRLPSLSALRVFEAAGRHLSFTKAAGELHVTQAAVSHQIKALEEQLGVQLFRRAPRRLLLTDAGQLYLPEVRAAFDRLSAATAHLRRAESSGVLTVSVLPSFAAKWLVPRLRRFRDRHPEFDVRVAADDHPVDFGRDDVDLALRYGSGNYPGVTAERFLTEALTPMLSPALLQAGPPLRIPGDLAGYTLLQDDMSVGWSDWLGAAGAVGVNPHRGPAFNDSSMVLQAALDGQGVALGRTVLAADDLASGRLVRPFPLSLPSPSAYWVVYPPRSAQHPKIVAFRDWLKTEVGGPAPGTGAEPDLPDPARSR